MLKRNKFKLVCSLLLSVLFLTACFEEHENGPLKGGGTVPAPITEFKSTPLPGGARITYKLPNDDQIIAVEATYDRNGKKVTTSSSVFNSFIKLEGMRGLGQKRTAQLVTVSKTGKKSAPVSVPFEIAEASIDQIFTSLKIEPYFKSVKVSYKNPNPARFEMLFYIKDSLDNFNLSRSLFFNENNRISDTVKYFEATLEKNVFAVNLIDRWDNTTPLIKKELQPFPEIQLDRTKFKNPRATTDVGGLGFGTVPESLWNGVTSGFFTGGYGFVANVSDYPQAVPPYDVNTKMAAFSIDLGVLAKISRMRLWHHFDDGSATDNGFGQFDPKIIRGIWGIDKLPNPDNVQAEENWNTLVGWTLLLENAEILKPSGLPVGSLSAQDEAIVKEGFSLNTEVFDVPVRYVRVVFGEPFGGPSARIFLKELEFFGQLAN